MDKTVLAYIESNHQYLMLLRNKKKDDLNEGKWIGIGGHIESGETPDDALKREIKEETNLDVTSYKLRGLINFKNLNYEEIMYLYTVDAYKGELDFCCDEGTLKFVDIDEVPSLNLWEGDRIFLKLLNENRPYFELTLIYENDRLIKSELK